MCIHYCINYIGIANYKLYIVIKLNHCAIMYLLHKLKPVIMQNVTYDYLQR
jgi:hypothetical protein